MRNRKFQPNKNEVIVRGKICNTISKECHYTIDTIKKGNITIKSHPELAWKYKKYFDKYGIINNDNKSK